jgi:hypothetical protein
MVEASTEDTMTQYHAHVEYDGRFWNIQVAGVGWSTHARHLDEVDPLARQLVAEMNGAASASIDLAVHVKIPEQAQQHMQRAEQLRMTAAEAEAQAAAEVEAATRMLQEQGLPMQDIGKVLNGQ